jgi:hypothetical protein
MSVKFEKAVMSALNQRPKSAYSVATFFPAKIKVMEMLAKPNSAALSLQALFRIMPLSIFSKSCVTML